MITFHLTVDCGDTPEEIATAVGRCLSEMLCKRGLIIVSVANSC